MRHLRLLSAPRPHFIFGEDFNPVMKITAIDPERDLRWRCVSGHEPWADNDFRFQLESRGEHGTKLRSWQEYAVELDDDYYGNYNFNWGYYLESLRLYCDMVQASLTQRPIGAASKDRLRELGATRPGTI